ncbi:MULTISPECIES: type II toxin-antitoxin system RelE/ParE family toxin [unclassified Rhizobium]|uniref:type II toxin-antitoxin system RelE/ParE family toxin n=1 Tax=unclassified Rhizobium TaxID=2613769 RepID=UPI000EA93416|nr:MULTISPECIES: type II toxin-antitoxin system RelE/ParE family toxin [unclassified Rhizobium]AYG68079.1 type II toxin-antitoxin system RelE/ParE family toxin [Rhizobium sp. CCGE531]AYG74466.1 type II toxin-antitoxin system RelE/ParE family toxin [Rhizobium sp. CCGE532]
MELIEYTDRQGKSPFAPWFATIDTRAALKVRTAVGRIAHGHTSNVKSVGGGVMEYRLDYGPGYRIYFARRGDKLIILLAGGTKKRQQADIEAAQERWLDYKQRKGD